MILLAALSARGGVLTENFSANPLQDGWRIFGDTRLFSWNTTNQNLDVIWDSTDTNSYFYHPLGTILTRSDDFSVAFDLELNVATASGYSFELAIGLLNFCDATNADFQRFTGENSPNLVEFTYFPDTGFGATVWPVFSDTNSYFSYNGPDDYAIYAPNLDDWYHIVMTYSAAAQTMVTTMTNFEQTSGITVVDPIDDNFTDFRVDTLSVTSYQDDGEGDSIFAQGVVDNFIVTLPPPPVKDLKGLFTNGVWTAEFCSRTNWLYDLQRSTNLVCWTNVSCAVAGTGTNLFLQDGQLPATAAFYRVSASRP